MNQWENDHILRALYSAYKKVAGSFFSMLTTH